MTNKKQTQTQEANKKKRRKILLGVLIPVGVLATAAAIATPLAISCSNKNKTGNIELESGVSSKGITVKESNIAKGKDSSFTLEIPTGSSIKDIKISIGGTTYTKADGLTIDGTKILVPSSLMTDSKIIVKDITLEGVTPTPVVSGITLSTSTLKFEINKTAKIKATLAYTNENEDINWTINDASIATLSSTISKSDVEITLTGKKVGTATLTASCAGKTATCTVTVNPQGETISLNKNTVTLTTGQTDTLQATVTPATIAELTWMTSDSSICEVEANGLQAKITAKAKGSATITATTPNGATATCVVTVTSTVKKVAEFKEANISYDYDESDPTYMETFIAKKLNVTGIYEGETTVSTLTLGTDYLVFNEDDKDITENITAGTYYFQNFKDVKFTIVATNNETITKEINIPATKQFIPSYSSEAPFGETTIYSKEAKVIFKANCGKIKITDISITSGDKTLEGTGIDFDFGIEIIDGNYFLTITIQRPALISRAFQIDYEAEPAEKTATLNTPYNFPENWGLTATAFTDSEHGFKQITVTNLNGSSDFYGHFELIDPNSATGIALDETDDTLYERAEGPETPREIQMTMGISDDNWNNIADGTNLVLAWVGSQATKATVQPDSSFAEKGWVLTQKSVDIHNAEGCRTIKLSGTCSKTGEHTIEVHAADGTKLASTTVNVTSTEGRNDIQIEIPEELWSGIAEGDTLTIKDATDEKTALLLSALIDNNLNEKGFNRVDYSEYELKQGDPFSGTITFGDDGFSHLYSGKIKLEVWDSDKLVGENKFERSEWEVTDEQKIDQDFSFNIDWTNITSGDQLIVKLVPAE